VILFPSWAIAIFWLGSEALLNVLARQRYGLPLYAYGGGLMPLIACVVEGVPIALVLWGTPRATSSRSWRRSQLVLTIRTINWNSRKPFLRDLYRIKEGMTAAQVEQIMGNYTTGGGGSRW
jgi:hypothetical protein